MLRNYFTIALRHFWNNKTYVLANIAGLAIATAICILAYFHLAFNLRFNEMYDATTKNVYRIDQFVNFQNGDKYESAITHWSLMSSLASETPEIKSWVRYLPEGYGTSTIRVKDHDYKGSFTYSDSCFFLMFKHKFIYGNEKSAFNSKAGVVLSKVNAKKYFGNEDPMGKTITYFVGSSKKDFVVTGVVEQPTNNMFIFDVMARIENTELDNPLNPYRNVETFVEVPDIKSVPVVQKQLAIYSKDYLSKQRNYDPKIENIFKLVTFKYAGDRSDEIFSRLTYGKWRQSILIMVGGIAFLILLIACFNYTNTSIALAGTRIKEVALRKVMGSQRKHFIIQFLLEHAIISFIAMVLSLAISNLITPFYMGLHGTSDFSDYSFIAPFLMFVMIFTTLVSGAYPAFYISRLKTSDALRRNLKLKSGNWFTYSLLTLQMIITVAGLGMGISFANNVDYIINIDKGYDMENIITVPISEAGQGYKGYELYKSKIIENPDILDFAPSTQHISWFSWNETIKYKDREYIVWVLPTGINYLQTMGVELKLGRFFDKNRYSDTNHIIVNENYIKTTGITDPLNESIIHNGRPRQIIGVVKDYMQHGVTNMPLTPIMISLKRNAANIMVVKAQKGRLAEVNSFLEQKWTETFDVPYGGYLQIGMLDGEMYMYKLMRSVFLSVSAISMLLSLVGIYILITLIINKKTKEVGIRKVLGSSIGSIIFILGKNFIFILGIAVLAGSLAGVLIAKFSYDSLLNGYNRPDVSLSAFVISSLSIVVLTAFTISYKVFRAADSNPIESLRDE